MFSLLFVCFHFWFFPSSGFSCRPFGSLCHLPCVFGAWGVCSCWHPFFFGRRFPSSTLFSGSCFSLFFTFCHLEFHLRFLCFLLVRLFSVCALVPIFITFWGVTKFQDTYHGFLYFLTFLSFSLVDSSYCWCERNTGRHFIGFYYHKNKKGWDKNTGIKTLNTTTTTKIIGRQK